MTESSIRPGTGAGGVSQDINGYVEDVTQLLDVYEQRIFPGEPSAHRTDTATAGLLLRSLLSGLLHYTDARGLDFDEALEVARGIRTDDIATEQTYQVGDQVQTRYGPTLRGTVTNILTGEGGQPVYHVHVPGEDKPRTLEPIEITTAPPFGPVTTRTGPVKSATMAERMLIHLGARIRHGEADGPPVNRDHYDDRERLLAALASWSCKPKKTIRRDLAPKVILAYGEMSEPERSDIKAAPLDSSSSRSADAKANQAAALAASDFPYDITAGVPGADSEPAATHPAVRAAGPRTGVRRN